MDRETSVKVVGGAIGGAMGLTIIAAMYYGVVFLYRYKDTCGGYSPLWWYVLSAYGYLTFGNTSVKAIATMYKNATKSKALIEWEEKRRATAAHNIDVNVVNGATKDILEVYLSGITVLIVAIIGTVVCYGYTCDELRVTYIYTWAKVATVVFFLAAIGQIVPNYGAMAAYQKWAEDYDARALDNKEGPQPPRGEAAVPSEWSFHDICIAPCAPNMQVLGGYVILYFFIDGIVSLVYTSNTCGRHSPLWMYGLMVFVGPYGFLIVGKSVLGIYQSHTKSRERLSYEEICRETALQLSAPEDMLIKQGATLSKNGLGDSSVGLLLFSLYFLAMAGYGILLLNGEGYVCEEMKTTSLYGFAQCAVVAQIGGAMYFVYCQYTAIPAFIQWQAVYDEKMRETSQIIPPVNHKSNESINVATATTVAYGTV